MGKKHIEVGQTWAATIVMNDRIDSGYTFEIIYKEKYSKSTGLPFWNGKEVRYLGRKLRTAPEPGVNQLWWFNDHGIGEIDEPGWCFQLTRKKSTR